MSSRWSRGPDRPPALDAPSGLVAGVSCGQSSVHSEAFPDDRQRDLLPLPVPGALHVGAVRGHGVSRAVRRRLKQAVSSPWLVRQAVQALNDLYGA